MIRGLQRVGWNKVDMDFHSAIVPSLAHTTIFMCVTSCSLHFPSADNNLGKNHECEIENAN
jgi:hypothetical protein